jgi:hypothetical protein
MNNDNVLRRSQRLFSPKFEGLTQQHIAGDETVLLADDCHAEIFEYSGMKSHSQLAAVITDRRMFVFRGRGMTGAKKPWIIELRQIEETGVTRQGNTNIKYKGENGFPGLWKLVFGNEPQADLWMTTIAQACQDLAGAEERRRAETLARNQAELAQQRGEAPPPPAASAGPDDAQLGRLHDLIDDLRPFATPEFFRQPFGKGHGLDEAVQLVFRRLSSPEEARVCGEIMMVEMLVSARDDRIVEDALELMGATDEAVMRHQTGPAPKDIGDAAIALLRQHGGPGSMWDLWQQRDDVVVEMLCWHSIARLRLANAGLMDAVARP